MSNTESNTSTAERKTAGTPIDGDTLLEQLRWRYATKEFDPTRKISDEDWSTLEQALVLTPSSFGLQPWKFIVLTNQEIKNRLVEASWNQQQVADASHVVVFTVRDGLDGDDIEEYLQRIIDVRGVSAESLENYREMMRGKLLTPKPKFDVTEWATRQVYIALGNFMTSAALMGIDVCPMEGIAPAKYDEILGVDTDKYATRVVAAAGYRAADDRYATLAKVRYEADRVVQHID